MSAPAATLKKYNVVIAKLFEIILNLTEERQLMLLNYARQLDLWERRAHVRKRCSIPVTFETYDRVYSDLVKNISASGVFIQTRRPLFAGEEIVISFPRRNDEQPLRVKGEIAQATRAGAGVEFKDIDPELLALIAAFVEQIKK